MKTIKVYSPDELKDKFPDAFDYAFEHWKSDQNEIPWSDEIMDSLKSIFKASGLNLWDWSIGTESYCSYVKFTCSFDIRDDLRITGRKAYNWIKENILDDAKFQRVTYDKSKGGKGWRYDITQKDGTPWNCGFTGVCFDDDFVESLLDDVRGGCTLYDAFHNLAGVASHLMEMEQEYITSEACFLEQDHLQYTKEGRLV